MEGWEKLVEVEDLVRANVINAAMHSANIDSLFLNKKDSAYVFLGRYEIYVRKDDLEKAKETLQNMDDWDG